jgi:HSP20 family protein
MTTPLNLFNPVREFSLRNFLVDDASIGHWAPRVDVVETKTQYEISAELPGLDKEEVKITFENNTLELSGEKVREKYDNDNTYHKLERVYGKFNRSVYLGNDVEVNSIDAAFKNGLLKITVLKKPEALPKEIAIQ